MSISPSSLLRTSARVQRLAVALLLCLAGTAVPASHVLASPVPTFKLAVRDGALTPSRIVVPAGKAFRLKVRNTGTTPAELDSTDLHKEEVVGAGTSLVMNFRSLAPGKYSFFDDFHPGAKHGVLVAK